MTCHFCRRLLAIEVCFGARKANRNGIAQGYTRERETLARAYSSAFHLFLTEILQPHVTPASILMPILQAWKGDGKGGTDIGFGASVYPAAYVLAEYLERHPYLIRGKRVIELGTLLGTCFFTCTHDSATKTWVFTSRWINLCFPARLRFQTPSAFPSVHNHQTPLLFARSPVEPLVLTLCNFFIPAKHIIRVMWRT